MSLFLQTSGIIGSHRSPHSHRQSWTALHSSGSFHWDDANLPQLPCLFAGGLEMSLPVSRTTVERRKPLTWSAARDSLDMPLHSYAQNTSWSILPFVLYWDLNRILCEHCQDLLYSRSSPQSRLKPQLVNTFLTSILTTRPKLTICFMLKGRLLAAVQGNRKNGLPYQKPHRIKS